MSAAIPPKPSQDRLENNRMRTFCFQIQLDKLTFMTRDDIADILMRFQSEWPEQCVVKWADDDHVNLIVDSNEPNATWTRVKWLMLESKLPGGEFRNAMIITATGENGWDDFLLLHHYDENEPVDTLPESVK